MNRLIESGLLRQIPCGVNFSYILEDPGLFQATDYKVLHSWPDGGLLRCMRMLYNGQVMLCYMTEAYKPLSAVLPGLSSEYFLAVAESLIRGILDIKNNGFLFCGNVELSSDKIFVDTATMQVRLVYLPLSRHLFDSENDFENHLRSELLRLIRLAPGLTDYRVAALASDLMDGNLPLEELVCRMARSTPKSAENSRKPEASKIAEERRIPEERETPDINKKKMWLISMNAPKKVKILVNRDSFLIGKRGAAVDAGIDFNKLISRVHCRVDYADGEYTVTDMGSTNGTFLNGTRMSPDTPCVVKNEDILRLANSIFQITIR